MIKLSKRIAIYLMLAIMFVSCGGNEKKNEAKEAQEVAKKAVTSEKYKVDTASSVLNWEGSKAVVGDAHTGTFKLSTGIITLKDGKLESGNFLIDINSLTVTDIPADKPGNAKLKGHLLNADFFDVEKHASAAFEITSVEGNNVSGNLTLKGIKKNISFPASVAINGNNITFKSEEFNINRTDFEMKYGSGNFTDVVKDRAISDEVKISFTVNATK